MHDPRELGAPGWAMAEKQGLYDPAYEHDACGIGFIAHVHGVRSRDVVEKSLQLLQNLSHRSAVAADACTGDGAGILLQVPHVFLRRACGLAGITLPDAGSYGVGMAFLPSRERERTACERVIERTITDEGYSVLGWRDVPVDDAVLSPSTRRTRPTIRQVFVARLFVDREVDAGSSFEVALYIIRRKIEAALRAIPEGKDCYFASFSSRTIVYKGMLRPDQLSRFYLDLRDPDLASAIALVHSRFSTNTFPSWRLAHPYRFLCHNGEINTLRGNLNWMRVREATMASSRFGGKIDSLFPVCGSNQSDSASVDNVLELSPIYASYRERRGAPPYDPRVLLKLLLYGYASGVFSSRRLERAAQELVPCRYLTADQQPDHKTISEFRRRHLKVLEGLFCQVLQVCQKAGLVKLGHVALDGTKIKANASRHKAM